MIWSYSRLTSFENCKYEFYLNYILRDFDNYPREDNYYAEVGSYVHKILEMIFNKELALDEAAEYYVKNFDDNVFSETYASTMEKTFEACADYFAEVDFDWLNDYEILGVEKEVKFEINGYKFVGYIDLLLRDKRDGKIVVVDNKSTEYPFKTNGKLYARAKKSFDKYKKQMYLYCHAIKGEYGEFPKEITWNHFKDGGRLATIPFDEKEYNQTIDWLLKTIGEIEKEEDYEPSMNFFYCKNLCSFRGSCEYLADGGGCE